MSRAHIGIGSNIAPEQHVPWALQRLREELDVLAEAPVYRTPPIDRPEQDAYWNTMVVADVDEALEALEVTLRAMEANAGRVRTADAYAARELDLDVLLWNGEPPNAQARAELDERPWNQWCLHYLGDGPSPSTPEPPLA